MKDKVDKELELSKRMTGEVYPELVRLMKSTQINVLRIRSLDAGEEDFEHNGSIRFVIYIDGRMSDLNATRDVENDDDDAVIQGILADVDRPTPNQFVRFIGESDDDEDDSYTGVSDFSILNIDECPVFNHCSEIDYTYYCERVIETVEHLLKRERRFYDLMKKIDKIPQKRKVITEKTINV